MGQAHQNYFLSFFVCLWAPLKEWSIQQFYSHDSSGIISCHSNNYTVSLKFIFIFSFNRHRCSEITCNNKSFNKSPLERFSYFSGSQFVQQLQHLTASFFSMIILPVFIMIWIIIFNSINIFQPLIFINSTSQHLIGFFIIA
jgi:hypothetical protein